jgi:hypothetical protein
MKTDLLRQAFEAGEDHVRDQNRTDLSSRPDSPGFDEWQKTLSEVEENEPLASGFWCSSCEVFEDETYGSDKKGETCYACGCPTEMHKPAKVVEDK